MGGPVYSFERDFEASEFRFELIRRALVGIRFDFVNWPEKRGDTNVGGRQLPSSPVGFKVGRREILERMRVWSREELGERWGVWKISDCGWIFSLPLIAQDGPSGSLAVTCASCKFGSLIIVSAPIYLFEPLGLVTFGCGPHLAWTNTPILLLLFLLWSLLKNIGFYMGLYYWVLARFGCSFIFYQIK